MECYAAELCACALYRRRGGGARGPGSCIILRRTGGREPRGDEMARLRCRCLNVVLHCKEEKWETRPVPGERVLAPGHRLTTLTLHEIEQDLHGLTAVSCNTTLVSRGYLSEHHVICSRSTWSSCNQRRWVTGRFRAVQTVAVTFVFLTARKTGHWSVLDSW